MQYLDAISKMTEWSLFVSKANHSITVIQVYAPTSKAESWSWTVLRRPARLFRTNTQKRSPFHYRGLECKSRKSRNTWGNRHFGLGIWNEAGQRLIEFWQENALVITNTRHKRRLYTWTSPYAQHQNQIDIFFAAKDGEALYSQQKQDQELTVAQTMNSLLPNSDLNWRK